MDYFHIPYQPTTINTKNDNNDNKRKEKRITVNETLGNLQQPEDRYSLVLYWTPEGKGLYSGRLLVQLLCAIVLVQQSCACVLVQRLCACLLPSLLGLGSSGSLRKNKWASSRLFLGRIPVPVFLATSVPNTRQGIWKMMSHVFDLFIRWEIKCLLVVYLLEN